MKSYLTYKILTIGIYIVKLPFWLAYSIAKALVLSLIVGLTVFTYGAGLFLIEDIGEQMDFEKRRNHV